MLAVHAPKPFDGLHLCELDHEKYEALKARMNRHRPDAQILNGDANELVHRSRREYHVGGYRLLSWIPMACNSTSPRLNYWRISGPISLSFSRIGWTC